MAGARVILPNYNEGEDIRAIVHGAHEQLRAGDRILVVDDNSPDGTGTIADELAAEISSIEVLHRPDKQGLGRAHLAGFNRALASGADYVLEMDADFSHAPADTPRLIPAAEAGADLVL